MDNSNDCEVVLYIKHLAFVLFFLDELNLMFFPLPIKTLHKT